MSSFLLRRWARVLVPVAAVAVLAGCATGEQSTTPADADSSTLASEVPGTALEPALDHLHGLHLDSGGAVLAGTHTGLVDGTTYSYRVCPFDVAGNLGAAAPAGTW